MPVLQCTRGALKPTLENLEQLGHRVVQVIEYGIEYLVISEVRRDVVETRGGKS